MKNTLFIKICRFLLRINTISYIVIFTMFLLVLQVAISKIFPPGDDLNPAELENYAKEPIVFFFLGIIMVPIVETLLFQTLIIRGLSFIMQKIRVKCNFIPISISAIAFALSHFYNLRYVLQILPIGYILALAFVLARKRNKKINASLTVIAIHSLHNFILFMAKTYL